jgi:hypothetical protein
VHLAARVVRPADGDLGHPEPLRACEQEDLEVVDEPVLARLREEPTRDVGPEQLEAALRVAQRREHEEAPEAGEQEAEGLPVEGLADQDARAPHPPGADRDPVRGRGRCEEPRRVGRRRREIGVGDEDPRPAGGLDARAHGVPLAPVPRRDEHPDPGIARRGPPRHLGGAVGAAVVHDDDLEGHEPRGLELAGQAVERGGEPMLLPVRGHHHRVLGTGSQGRCGRRRRLGKGHGSPDHTRRVVPSACYLRPAMVRSATLFRPAADRVPTRREPRASGASR